MHTSQNGLYLEYGWSKNNETECNLGLMDTSSTYMGTCDLVGFKIIVGSFGALFSKWPVIEKRLAMDQNGLKFGTQGH